MLAVERQRRILDMVQERGAVKIGEMTELFSVSTETIRRDLLELERQKRLRRVHGGVMRIPQAAQYLEAGERAGKNRERKAELAQYAAGLVAEGDAVMVDCGSTAAAFARMLAARFEKLTVITNSLEVFTLLRAKEGYTLHLCTGCFLRRESAFCGPWALEMLDHFHVKTAFLFPSAVSMQYGIMDYDGELFHVQKKMIKQADRTVFLADSGKFEKSGLLKLADVGEGTVLVTDSGLETKLYDLYRENRVHVICGKVMDV